MVIFTASHALGYRELKEDLLHDRAGCSTDPTVARPGGRNDGCLATQQLLGVMHGRGVAWPSPPVARSVPGGIVSGSGSYNPGGSELPSDPEAPSDPTNPNRACLEEDMNVRERCANEVVFQVGLAGPDEMYCPLGYGDRPPRLAKQIHCRCSCELYDVIYRADHARPPPPPPPSLPCLAEDDLPPGYLPDRVRSQAIKKIYDRTFISEIGCL